jgi:hypothetical protein
LRAEYLIQEGPLKLWATIIQQKTGKPVTFEPTELTRESLLPLLKLRGGNFQDLVFSSRTKPDERIRAHQQCG